MKKISLFALLAFASILIISCTTKAQAPEPIPATPTEVSTVAPAEPTIVSTPIEEVEPETVVIDSAPPASATDADLDQKFAYIYGHLLGNNMVEQGLSLNSNQFIRGSSDFYNYVEPLISEDEIYDSFLTYQDFLDGVITEADLEDGEEDPVAEFSTFLDRFSYGYGYVVQLNLQSQGLILDLENFHAGVFDAFSEIELSYTEEEIDALFMAYQEKLMQEYEAMVEEYMAMNLAEAESFLEENQALEDVVTTESGLQYKVLSEGDGAKPTADSTVELDYMITFLDGSTGDNSYSRGEPSVFTISNLIPGFIEGMKLMNEGSHYRFYVHPDLAYGAAGNEMIPPNTLLIFDVELHKILD